MNKLIRFFISVISLFLCLQGHAFDFEVDGFQFNIVSLTDNTAELVSCTSDDCGDLIIPSSVTYGNRDIKIVSIGEEAFVSNKLTSLTCGAYLRSIGSRAFATCANLKKVTLSEATDSLSAAFLS